MTDLKIDLSQVYGFVPEKDLLKMQEEIDSLLPALYSGTGKGNDFLGWINLPSQFDPAIIDSIEKHAAQIRLKAEIYIVIGIGGSYLGARAVIEALSHHFSELHDKGKDPFIVYAGNQLSEEYMADLLEILDVRDYALTVISKSGTTTEPALAFRILRKHLENKYGREEARKRIIAITDAHKGALKKLADEEAYPTYVVPDDVGGRYSVLTPVGLLPIAVAGFDIKALLKGAAKMEEFVKSSKKIGENPVAAYAAARNALYRSGKTVEILVNFLPNLLYFNEWWKQLYGESEGKEGKGLFPAGVSFTTDLHSMGQYIQQGLRNIFETVISVEKSNANVVVPNASNDDDGLNYLAGKHIHYVNRMAELGTMLAHVDGGVPNIRVSVPLINEDTLGQLIYFFEMSCGLSGYLLGVNPFNQPGVEEYKSNMFALLGKPGFEKQTEEIQKKISKIGI